ncbi:histidinol-phosphate transaminase [Calycomorphotria hydatis]|uniref:Histidinol-phosphate aminotransferase n=1 Tax=Calycomorphotria hydatis TaxID=2528027 RepID=A0A517TCP2_9PLAN|nr:histidinol-phosphate transaminase [Calycomorphotria hydatis]QDT66138.1 Histidinol-phosphate aminotransferase [Calycomorphotria hydatis]
MSRFRPQVEALSGYVPGEQPQETGWVKLNTNENPYPPSEAVIEAITERAKSRLNVYPDPLARAFCQIAAERFQVEPEWVLPANGSDENLTILLRSFVDPGERIACPYPSYILYETLGQIQGAEVDRLQLKSDWSWDFETAEPIVARSKMVLLPSPNSPSGNRWPLEDISRLIPPTGVLVLDEAYGEFADPPHDGAFVREATTANVIMTRSLSKAYSLAGLRFGYAIAHPDLIAGMRKVKDSYNCDALSIAGACAALSDQDWLTETIGKIRATRTRLSSALKELGFNVVPSEANFVWATHPSGEHERIYAALKDRKILIRYMKFPEAVHFGPNGLDGLRISIGTDTDIDHFLTTLKEVV